MTVEKALLAVSGVKDVVANLKDKTVKITYVDGKVALPDLEKTIADAGYKVVGQ
jgi:copper chaperone CopZ